MQTLIASPRPLRYPQDILRFLYWVFFKPITLARIIIIFDKDFTENPVSFFSAWKRLKNRPDVKSITSLTFFYLTFLASAAFLIELVFETSGFGSMWYSAILGIISGLLLRSTSFGVTGIARGIYNAILSYITVFVAVIFGPFLYNNISQAAGRYESTSYLSYNGNWVAGFIIVLITQIFFISLPLLYRIGKSKRVAPISFFYRALISLVPLQIFGSVTGGMLAAGGRDLSYGYIILNSICYLMSYYGIFFYFFEAPFSLLHKYLLEGGLRYSPVFWDELIFLPLLSLDGLLVKIAQRDRNEGMQAIAYVASSFKQGWAAKKALLELTASDLNEAKTLAKMAEIAENLSWLPDTARQDMQELLLGIEQASQHARAALESETLYNRQEQLRMGLQVIDRVLGGLAYAENSALARQMIPALEGWKRVFGAELGKADLQEKIPNVYVSGSPLIKDSKSFKGRKDLFRALTNQLVSPAEQRPALLLFGARRMGKTSTLKQLPVQLGPQIIPVSVDLQKISTVQKVSSLLALVAKEFITAAQRERRVKFPPLDEKALAEDPYFAFQEWLSELTKILGDYYWILLSLDEFESLGGMRADGRVDERIFQLLRGIIQHHPRITVLLSGAHTLEELPAYWSNYFINSKMLKVGPLEEEDALELITRPIPDFPLVYDENALQYLLAETGCHPNWMQFTCREVVERLNEANRIRATLADVEWALARVPDVLAGDFKDLWEGHDATDLMRAILKEVAKTEHLPAQKLAKYQKDPAYKKTLDFILRRDILIFENDTYRFRANLLRRWIKMR